jgi:hypothetical protein
MRIRYHLDEHVGNAVAHGLRLRGLDVTTTKDAGLIGLWRTRSAEQMQGRIEFI